jgi:7,8-dihydroneopterin aldolase/epimerase/oxygenase
MLARLAVTLQGMRFHARVGVLAHERDVAQPVEVDLTVWRDGQHGELLDYSTLYALTHETVMQGHVPYLEDVAERVVRRALAMPGVDEARVAVRKPHVPLPGPLAYAEVVLHASADGRHRSTT